MHAVPSPSSWLLLRKECLKSPHPPLKCWTKSSDSYIFPWLLSHLKELTWSKLEQTCIFFVRVFSEIEPPNPSPLKSTRVDAEEANWPRAASRVPSHSFCTCYASYSYGSCTGRPYVWMVKMRSLFKQLYPSLILLLLFWYWILIVIFYKAQPTKCSDTHQLIKTSFICYN